jgi:autotransporter-associated beta strand protein
MTFQGTGNTLISGAVTNGTGTGASALRMDGTGTLTLTNQATYTGATTVNNGAFVLSGANASKEGMISRLNDLKGTTTTGPTRMSIPDMNGAVYGLVANVQNRRDLKGDGVEAVDVILHLWATS